MNLKLRLVCLQNFILKQKQDNILIMWPFNSPNAFTVL